MGWDDMFAGAASSTGIADAKEEVVKESKKRFTWKDFTLEEHVRGYFAGLERPIPAKCRVKCTKIGKNSYRVNAVDVELAKANQAFVLTAVVKAIETPDGYVFSLVEDAKKRGEFGGYR